MSDEYRVPELIARVRMARETLTEVERARELPPNLLWELAGGGSENAVKRALFLHAMIEVGHVGEFPEPNFAPYKVCPTCGYVFG